MNAAHITKRWAAVRPLLLEARRKKELLAAPTTVFLALCHAAQPECSGPGLAQSLKCTLSHALSILRFMERHQLIAHLRKDYGTNRPRTIWQPTPLLLNILGLQPMPEGSKEA